MKREARGLTGKWSELHRSRFSELPADCGSHPAESNDPVLRDWSQKSTTPDQLRIERYLDRFDLRGKRILHIGIGNSGLARRFHAHTREIVGTTLDQPELQLAQNLSYPNYSVVLHNKYSGETAEVRGPFDFIVENNPTSACCCVRHLAELFQFLAETLSDGGQIVTDRIGLAWIPEGANPCWSFDFEDLQAVASAAGLDAWRVNRDTYVLCRGAPAKPSLRGQARGLFRMVTRFAIRALESGYRRVR